MPLPAAQHDPRHDQAPSPRAPSRQHVRFAVTRDNIRIAYAVSGQGPPLIRVANRLSHLDADWESPLWRHWFTALTRDYQLICYDGRGCGLSDRTIPPLTFEDWVTDLEAVIETLGLKRFSLLGISRGAPTAIAYTARNPERVSHLVLQGGFARGRLRRGGGERQEEEAELTLNLIRLGWTEDNAAGRQFFATRTIPDGTPEQHRSFNDIVRLASTAENAIADIRLRFQVEVSELAARVACPTLVLHSTRDNLIPFEEGRHLAGLIPNARFVSLESRNHFLLENEPAWRTWLSELRGFLPRAFPSAPGFAELTQRERELLEHIAQGLSNPDIATRIGLSPKTVKNHLTRIFAKLGARHRAQAIVLARQAGLGERTRA